MGRVRRTIVAVVSVALLSSSIVLPSDTPAAAAGPKPTIVFVHGAWADSSGWNGAIELLQRKGYTVLAPANPLRNVYGDAAYLRTVLANISGDVVLVGHSYGGMVTTNAALTATNVKALVYIAAFVPEVGDTLLTLSMMNPGSQLGPDTLDLVPYPGGVDTYIKRDVFHDAFCADVPAPLAAVMGAAQRPLDAAILAEPSGPPAWRLIPSWYMVATGDRAIPPATEAFMAKRAGATTVTVKGSHAVMVSHPGAVADLVLRAAHAVEKGS
jgi:pimeloyl-ACP methyl ester carboxylesterase